MIPVATITRRIQALEDSLNLRLLNRHARKLTLTEAGERFYKDCSPLLERLASMTEEITDECRGASGRIRISAPSNLTKRMMMPMFNAFMEKYPDIHIELMMSNQADDLDPTEWDVIFRVGPQRDSSLIARKIGEVKDIWLPALNTCRVIRNRLMLKSCINISCSKVIHCSNGN